MSTVGDYAELAERYCSLIEEADRADPLRFLERIEELLSKLYASASKLPDVEATSDDPQVPKRVMSTAEWTTAFERLNRLLGSDDRYQTEGLERSLADDLLDIYRELRDGLGAMRSGAAPEDVLWEWRFGFEAHWAAHAEGALFAIRNVLGRASS